jgi:hypothetical protein
MKNANIKSRSKPHVNQCLATFRRPDSEIIQEVLGCEKDWKMSKEIEAFQMATDLLKARSFRVLTNVAPPAKQTLRIISDVSNQTDMGLGLTKKDDFIGWLDDTWYSLSLLDAIRFLLIMQQIAKKEHSYIGLYDEGGLPLWEKLIVALGHGQRK